MALDGLRVGVTSARKGRELAEALRRRGASVLHGPTVGGDLPEPAERIVADTDRVIAARPTWLVASTGVGMRLWSQTAAEHGRQRALEETAAAARCVARGPKAVGGLAALGVQPEWTSEEQTDAAVAAWLAERVTGGEQVAVQLHGTATAEPFAPVADAGAHLLTVATYRHELPDDRAGARALIAAVRDGELDVVTFTSPGAVRNLVAIAEEDDPAAAEALRAAFGGPVAVAAIGPVTADVIRQVGWSVTIEPSRWRTGELVRTLDRWATDRAGHLRSPD